MPFDEYTPATAPLSESAKTLLDGLSRRAIADLVARYPIGSLWQRPGLGKPIPVVRVDITPDSADAVIPHAGDLHPIPLRTWEGWERVA